jgi:N-carbamoyl-L-amino-acid hydrolase
VSAVEYYGFESMTSLPDFGNRVLALADRLAAFSDDADGLTCTFLSTAHRRVARMLAEWMQAAGLAVEIDEVGNVVGRLRAAAPGAQTLIVGSHYDTVRNGGKYDGRLGILLPLVVIEHLKNTATSLPYNLELIAFSEEEGVRFATPYIGSTAVAGRFDPNWLARRDGDGVTLEEALRAAGNDPASIPALARQRDDLLGFLELHIEQGPVLLHENLPVGIVSAIAGAVRYLITIRGEAGHAGTVPMALRHDAAAAAAEVILFVEQRCGGVAGLVGTIGELTVPNGAVNVIPGQCAFSLDVRAGDDATREAAATDILREINAIASRRGVAIETRKLLGGDNVPCAPHFQNLLGAACRRTGAPVRFLASGAGHDAAMFGGLCDIGMLFVRCGNGGVSHSPDETVSAADADVAARILLDLLCHDEF